MASVFKVTAFLLLVASPAVFSAAPYSRRQQSEAAEAIEDEVPAAAEYDPVAPKHYSGAYEPSKDSASGRGYLQEGYAPKGVVLSDDYSIEAKFPYPKFTRPYFPFEGSFDSTRHRRAAEDVAAAEESPVAREAQSDKAEAESKYNPTYDYKPAYEKPSYDYKQPAYEAYPAVQGDEIAYGANTGYGGAFNWYADYPVRTEYKKY